jgi:glycerol-3-phosphate acyltransferase PlsY
MEWLILVVGVLGGYCLGSISSAVVVCKLMRLPDPRLEGSKNPGATNVLRIGGKLPAALTLIGDVLKGFLPVLLVKLVTTNPMIISMVFLAAVCGHLYPIFFGFKGGKGVATALGALMALSPTLGGIFIFTWIGVFALFRYSSLAALVALVSMPFWAYALMDVRYAIMLALLTVVISWRHRENISRLMKGQETKSTFSRSK